MLPAPRTNRPRIAAWIVVALAFVPSAWHAWNARGMPFLGNFNNDDGLYLVGAKSLAEGNSYRILSLPGEPCQTKYPPLYPALLALVWRWSPHFPENLAALGVLAWLMAPLTVLAASRFYSEVGVAPRDRLALCAFLAVHPLVSMLGTHLLAELPFVGLVFAAIALAERAARRPDGYGLAALAGAVAGLAYLTKSAGIVLLVSSPAVFLWQRRRRAAAAFFLAMLPAVAGWQAWTAGRRFPSDDPVLLYYTDYLAFHFRTVSFGEIPLVVAKNLQMLVRSIGELFLVNPGGPGWITAISIPLALVALAGAAQWLGRVRAFHCAAFAAGLSLLLLAWHPPTDRLALPLLPPAAAGVYFMGLSLFRTAARRGAGMRGSLASAVCGLGPVAVVSLIAYTTAGVHSRFIPFYVEAARRSFEARLAAYRWIERHTPPQAAFLAHAETALYLYTRRHGMRAQLSPMIYYRNDAGAFRRFLTSLDEFARARGLDYILLTAGDGFLMDGPGDEVAIAQAALRASRIFRLAWRSPGVEIYERVEP